MTVKKKPLRIALYGRYSTDKQRKTSIEDQYRDMERELSVNAVRYNLGPYKIVQRYQDPEISGGTAQRPEYIRMLADARAHKFDLIVAVLIDRVWRNRKEFGNASTEFEDAGLHLLTLFDGGDSRKHAGWNEIMGKVQEAEGYRYKVSYHTRRGMRGVALAGRTTGGKAYGYDATAKGRAINRDEAKIVLRIFKLRRDGISPKMIARTLNDENIPSPGSSWNRSLTGKNRKPTDKGWRSNAIAGDPARGTGILNNPIYRGEVIWGRTRWVRSAQDSKVRKVEVLPEAEWVRHKRPELRIVPDDLWKAVQQIQTKSDPKRDAIRLGIKRAKAGRGRGPGYWLSSIIVCGSCGANYIGYGPNDYICGAHQNGGKCGNGLHFSRDDTHKAMFGLLKEYLLHPDIIAAERKRCEALLKSQERADRDAAQRGVDTSAIDAQIASTKKARKAIGDEAYGAAMERLLARRDEMLAVTNGKSDAQATQARKAVAALKDFAKEYSSLVMAVIDHGDPVKVEKAREATRALLQDGQIELKPTAQRDAVTGKVQLVGLGAQVLRLEGSARSKFSNRGSGGLLLHCLTIAARGHVGRNLR